MRITGHKHVGWRVPCWLLSICVVLATYPFVVFPYSDDQNRASELKINLVLSAENPTIAYHVAKQNAFDTLKLSPSWSSMYFEFSMDKRDRFSYSYRLIGSDTGWSRWSKNNFAAFSKLQPGHYSLNVRAKDDSSSRTIISSYPFIIPQPWYTTLWAYSLCITAACIFVYLLIQKKLNYTELKNSPKVYPDLINFYHSESDKIISSFEKEELIAEVNAKNKELATLTMHVVERGKLVSKIREELITIVKNNPALAGFDDFKIILRMLADAEKTSSDWEQFSLHFDEVHRNFLAGLKAQCPALSTTDLKLCAYLRLNLSSKEIAQSMNITVKGVEVSRYRLRKKLNISKEVNLLSYLLQLASSNPTGLVATDSSQLQSEQDDLKKFLSFFNKSMTAKFISQGGYDLSSEGIVFKRPIAHNKG